MTNLIENIFSIYDFINTTLIPSVQPLRWYGNYVIPNAAMMIDMSNRYIGVVRIRQHRIKSNSCHVVENLKFLNISCCSELTYSLLETRKFEHGWENKSNHSLSDRMHKIWWYSSAFETGTFRLVGNINHVTFS